MAHMRGGTPARTVAAKRRLRSTFSQGERIAIAELVAFTEILAESDRNKPSGRIRTLGAMLLERCANIVRGESAPREFTDTDVLDFAKFWKVETPATFNTESTWGKQPARKRR